MPDPMVSPTQLRAAIDAGETGEKVNFPDPAAAPLGTDEEAGGAAAVPIRKPMPPKPVRKPISGLAIFVVATAAFGRACLLVLGFMR